MSLKELNSAEIEQVSGGTFLLKSYLFSRLFNLGGSGCTSCNPNNNVEVTTLPAPTTPLPIPTAPIITPEGSCSPFSGVLSKWFKNFKF